MLAQLRIYDIKAGQMEQWLELFRDKVVPMHAKYDLPVLAAWVDPKTSQFVWVRGFAGDGTIEEQETRYRGSEDRARVIGDEPKRFIERMEIRDLEQVYPIG